MKIAFDTGECSGHGLLTAAALGRHCGFDALEISGSHNLLNPDEDVRQVFSKLHLQISAIHVGSKVNQLFDYIKLAAELGSEFIRLSSGVLFDRNGGASTRIFSQLQSAADAAASKRVSILIDNQPVAGSALRLWHLLDRLNHPSIGCCWNTVLAARAGDAPAVAVPMLNTRIRYVHLQDAKIIESALVACNLGEGSLPLHNTTNRLRGIGFEGCLLVGISQEASRSASELEQSLLATRTVLQQWQILPVSAAS